MGKEDAENRLNIGFVVVLKTCSSTITYLQKHVAPLTLVVEKLGQTNRS